MDSNITLSLNDVILEINYQSFESELDVIKCIYIHLLNIRVINCEHTLWSKCKNFLRVCIILSSLIMKFLYYEHNFRS